MFKDVALYISLAVSLGLGSFMLSGCESDDTDTSPIYSSSNGSAVPYVNVGEDAPDAPSHPCAPSGYGVDDNPPPPYSNDDMPPHKDDKSKIVSTDDAPPPYSK